MNREDRLIFMKAFSITLTVLMGIFTCTYFVSGNFVEQGKQVSDPVKVQKNTPKNILIMTKENEEDIPEYFTLLRIDPINNEILISTLPRNTAAYLNGLTDTLMQSYAYAGPLQVTESLEKSYNIEVDYYINTTLNEFAEILDCFGSIEYDIFQNILIEDDFKRVVFKLDSGVQTLVGKMCMDFVKYADISYVEKNVLFTDIIKSYFMQNNNKTLGSGIENKIIGIIDEVETNISSTGVEDLYNSIKGINFQDVKILTQNISGEVINDCLYLDSVSVMHLERYI